MNTDNISKPSIPTKPMSGSYSLPRKQLMITFTALILTLFICSLDQTIVGTALPRIISDLGGFSLYTWVSAAYIIASAVSTLIVGKLVDMYGRKSFYIGGLVIFILSSFAAGLSQTMTQLIIFRGVQGIGAGILMANTFTVVGDLFSPAERGKYIGYLTAVFGLSSVIGPTLGGYLTDSLSWHWVFFINIPLGLLIIFLFLRYFPNLRPDNLKHSVDYPGLATFVLAAVPLMLAINWGGVTYPWLSYQVISMLAFSAIMFVLFVFIEKRSKEPILPLSLFKNGIVSLSMVISFLIGIGMFGAILFIPLYFQGVLGVSPTYSGNLLMPMMLGLVAGSFISGQLMARKGGHYKVLGLIGTAVMALGLGLLSRMGLETGYATAVINIVITGLGLGITMPLYTLAVQNIVPYSLLGTATSATTFFRSLGGAFGLGILGSVMNNRFASEFISYIPDEMKTLMPPDKLATLTQNPRALMSAQAQSQLQDALNHIGTQGPVLFNQLLQGVRQALNSSLSEIFLITFIVLIIAFVANIFLKEKPLRKQVADLPSAQKSGSEIS